MARFEPDAPPFFEQRRGGGPMMDWETKHQRAKALDQLRQMRDELDALEARLTDATREATRKRTPTQEPPDHLLLAVEGATELLRARRRDAQELADLWGLHIPDTKKPMSSREMKSEFDGLSNGKGGIIGQPSVNGDMGFSFANGGDGNGNRRNGAA